MPNSLASMLARRRRRPERPVPRPVTPSPERSPLVVAAVTPGAYDGLRQWLRSLPSGFEAPVVVAAGDSAARAGELARWLDRVLAVRVVEAEHGASLVPGRVTVGAAEGSFTVGPEGAVQVSSGPSAVPREVCVLRLVRSCVERAGAATMGVFLGPAAAPPEAVALLQAAGGRALQLAAGDDHVGEPRRTGVL